ncbi:MAG: hypothetical protein NW237_05845 [Cyanobacteriota bacterium]|nr:hypothetical protein [Cyanobacteriota bacterium]
MNNAAADPAENKQLNRLKRLDFYFVFSLSQASREDLNNRNNLKRRADDYSQSSGDSQKKA